MGEKDGMCGGGDGCHISLFYHQPYPIYFNPSLPNNELKIENDVVMASAIFSRVTRTVTQHVHTKITNGNTLRTKIANLPRYDQLLLTDLDFIPCKLFLKFEHLGFFY